LEYQGKVLEVDGAEPCAWARKHAVKKKLDKYEGHGVGSHIAREADAIAANCYAGAIRIIFFPDALCILPWCGRFPFVYGTGCCGS
jgi:hypothetical protein